MIILFAAVVGCFLVGLNVLSASASAHTRHASPNYYYLPDPKVVTADANTVFVLDGEGAGKRLLAFNAFGSLAPTPPRYPLDSPLSPNVSFIKHAGNMIFLFEEDGFTAVSYNNQTRIFTLHTPVKVEFANNFQLFDVKAVNASTYRVFYASTSVTAPRYGWTEYSTSNWSPTNSFLSDNLTVSNSIQSIAADGASTLYINVLNLWDTGETYNIYQVNISTPGTLIGPVNPTPLSSFKSLSVIQGKATFVYINNNKGLTLFDKNIHTNNPFVIHPDNAPPSAFSAAANRDPYFVTTTTGQNYAYVIDRQKLSVDRYIIKNDSTLEFDAIVVAHRGGDRGFFNTPTTLTLINSEVRKGNDIASSEYLVTDRAGQVMYNSISSTGTVTASPFFEDTSTRLSTFVRATYDNYDTVYIYDYDTIHQRNRVRTFTLDGRFSGVEYINFGHVTHLFADANRTVYALDSVQERMHVFGVNVTRTHVTLPPTYATQNTRGVYSEQLDAVILANATNQVIVLSLDGTYYTLTFGETVIDVATDALGNLLLLTADGTKYYISQFARNNQTITTTATWRQEITGATVALSNPSLNLDRMNKRILYIGTRHAIESFELGAGAWSPNDHEPDTAWKDTSSALRRFDTSDTNSVPVFLTASGDGGAVIYEYPGGTRALAHAPKNAVLKVLDFSTYFVMYENPATGKIFTGYVSKRAVKADEPYSVPRFENARVIFSHTIVYKYPTTDRSLLPVGQTLSLFTLAKNFEYGAGQTGGLHLWHRVTATDARGFDFFEIRLRKNADGTYFPIRNDDKTTTDVYVGYVNASHVMDYTLGPSIKKFLPNATVRIPASHNISQIQIYERDAGAARELPNEVLKNKQKIRVLGKLNKSREYTQIHYYDDVLGWTQAGWIKTEYIVMDGLSAMQLIAIAALSMLVVGGGTFAVIYLKRRHLS